MASGTLGTSFLYLPKRWRSLRGGSLARAYWWGGLRAGMHMLMAAPAWHSLAVQESRVIERLGATCVIPWGTFLPRFAENFLTTLVDTRPDFVSMFLPMLYALLAECRRRRMEARLAFDSVQYLLIVGAPMTPRSREQLKEELGVRDIFEGLGNPEGLTAMECSFHRGHHIFSDCCYVEIVDPKTGALLPAGKEIVPYDVRLCLDDFPELIGVPFAVVRGEKSAPYLKLLIQRPATGDPSGLGARLRALLRQRLQIDAREEWNEELPERWKGVAVLQEKDWGTPRV